MFNKEPKVYKRCGLCYKIIKGDSIEKPGPFGRRTYYHMKCEKISMAIITIIILALVIFFIVLLTLI
jgi:hypothetical protein